MRNLVVVLAACLLVVVSATKGMIDIDVTTIKSALENGQSKLPINSGDDDSDDEGSAVQSDEASGSGSGFTTPIAPATKEVEARVYTQPPIKTTKKPTNVVTEMPTEHVKSTPMSKETHFSTEEVIVVKKNEEKTHPPSEIVMTIRPTTDESMLGGGVSNNNGDVAARKGSKQVLQVLTTEVIAAVVVGGVCAIILIAFLVYRLRKRDEGSYILTDTAYKDTKKLGGDTGKEAFV